MTTQDYRTRSPLRIFLSYFKPHRRLFALDMTCAFLIACIDLAFPLVSRAAMYSWLPQRQFRTFFIVMAVVVAAYLLRETDLTMAEIARQVGYESQSKFTAAFKEQYGLLPTAYRRG